MTNWKQLIRKRVLVGKTWSNNLAEVVVIEVSPSGERVKFKYVSGYEAWEQADSYIVREVLTPECRGTWSDASAFFKKLGVDI